MQICKILSTTIFNKIYIIYLSRIIYKLYIYISIYSIFDKAKRGDPFINIKKKNLTHPKLIDNVFNLIHLTDLKKKSHIYSSNKNKRAFSVSIVRNHQFQKKRK